MRALRHDLRFDFHGALRSLRRSPGFTVTALLSTALGVGIATLIFGVDYALVLRPLPLPDPDRLVAVSMTGPWQGVGGVSYADFLDFAAQGHSFAGQAVHFTGGSLTLLDHGRPERVASEAVSPDTFQVLGVAPLLGRTFRPEEDRPGAPCTVILAYDLWQRRYGGDPAIVGRTIVADEAPCRVLGVMPRGFRFWVDQEVWVPLFSRPEVSPSRAVRNLWMIARLRPGVPLAAAQADVKAIARRFTAKDPESNLGWHPQVRPLRRFSLPSYAMRRMLPGSAWLILLIAGANLMHLVLVRTDARRRELAIRAAFGAGPARIARQIAAESALLAGAGGCLGTLAAAAALHAAEGARAKASLPYWIRFEAGPAVALVALAATAALALVLALPAMLETSRELRPNLARVLKDGGGAGHGRSRQVFRAALIVAEVAVSVVLLTASLLLARSLLHLRGERGGIGAERLSTAWLLLPGDRYADAGVRALWLEDLLLRLRDLPDVEMATVSDDIFSYLSGGQADLLADEADRSAPPVHVFLNTIGSHYFATLGAPLAAGRELTRAEVTEGAPLAVVNETLARRLWPDASALGRTVSLLRGGRRDRLTVVGVASDIRHQRLRLRPTPSVYVPFRYGVRRRAGIVLRAAGDPRRLLPEVARQAHAMDPQVPVFFAATFDELREVSVLPDRLSTESAILIGASAFLLSLVGVYGVLSYTVSLRLREIGIRLALGARRGDVMRRIVGRGLVLGLLGIGIGIGGATLLGRRLSPLLYGVSPIDPFSYTVVAFLVLDTVFVACYLPARRVLEVDPVDALRKE